MEKLEPNHKARENFPVSEALDRLRRIAHILREMGLRVIDRSITEEKLVSKMPFPIVRDGLDGIQAEYSKQRGLEIFFTNTFENPDDPKRQEIERRLREAGLI